MIDIPSFPNIIPNKELFLKLLEEAAETFSAWEDFVEDDFNINENIDNILNETADVMQVCMNIFAAFSKKPNPYILDMIERNEARGRYDKEDINEGFI